VDILQLNYSQIPSSKNSHYDCQKICLLILKNIYIFDDDGKEITLSAIRNAHFVLHFHLYLTLIALFVRHVHVDGLTTGSEEMAQR